MFWFCSPSQRGGELARSCERRTRQKKNRTGRNATIREPALETAIWQYVPKPTVGYEEILVASRSLVATVQNPAIRISGGGACASKKFK